MTSYAIALASPLHFTTLSVSQSCSLKMTVAAAVDKVVNLAPRLAKVFSAKDGMSAIPTIVLLSFLISVTTAIDSLLSREAS